MSSSDVTPAQTPAQWAVRWHGLVVVALLLASVPVVHLFWHGLLGRDEPLLRTRSQLPAPVATVDNVFDGRWMLTKERQLREDSPVVWWLANDKKLLQRFVTDPKLLPQVNLVGR